MTTRHKKHDWQQVVDDVLESCGERSGRWVMGAFWVAPLRKFINQQEDERIVLMLREHPVTNIPWLLMCVVAAVVPMLILPTNIFAGIPVRFVVMGTVGWYVLIFAFGLEKFLKWYYSVFIVTNERVVDIDFYNLVHRVVTTANLNHIEEPRMITGGFIRSIFQYGDVTVSTAAEDPSIEAEAVPWPNRVVDIISRLAEELEKRRERGE